MNAPLHCDSEKTQPPRRQSLQQTEVLEATSCGAAAGQYEVNDVLCSRDKLSYSHPGNKRFRQLVIQYREKYQNAPSRAVKSKITFEIVATIKECGGRFVKQDETTGVWEEVTKDYAHEKVSHALRSARDPERPKPKQKRQNLKYVPSTEENALFEAALADQQRIFESLTAQLAKGRISDRDFEDIETILEKI